MDHAVEIQYDAPVTRSGGKPAKPAKPTKAELRALMTWLGARGASRGGKARWQGVSAEERSRLAKKAVAAREAKRKKG